LRIIDQRESDLNLKSECSLARSSAFFARPHAQFRRKAESVPSFAILVVLELSDYRQRRLRVRAQGQICQFETSFKPLGNGAVIDVLKVSCFISGSAGSVVGSFSMSEANSPDTMCDSQLWMRPSM
jgi:hypothetical protein